MRSITDLENYDYRQFEVKFWLQHEELGTMKAKTEIILLVDLITPIQEANSVIDSWE